MDFRENKERSVAWTRCCSEAEKQMASEPSGWKIAKAGIQMLPDSQLFVDSAVSGAIDMYLRAEQGLGGGRESGAAGWEVEHKSHLKQSVIEYSLPAESSGAVNGVVWCCALED